ncbi:MAG: hypothetical protein AB7O47_09040 [Flavobacteriales bacterium]
MKLLFKTTFLILFLLSTIFSNKVYSQHFNHNNGNVDIIGIANDTVFRAYSKECLIVYSASNNQFEITISLTKIKSGKHIIDSLLHSLKNPILKIIGNVEGDVFNLFSKENSSQDHTLSGELTINNNTQTIQETYRIYTSPSRKHNKKTMFLDLKFYFDPSQLDFEENRIFSNPMELIIQGGYVNLKD